MPRFRNLSAAGDGRERLRSRPREGTIRRKYARLEGNRARYNPDRVPVDPESPLWGRRIIFLGSSVTEGFASCNCSFVEYLARRDGVIPYKETVSGTTLVTRDERSYLPRMRSIDPGFPADAFVCQLSTNDATQGLPLGDVTPYGQRSGFGEATVAGALETVVACARETWGCPVAFYTGPRYASPAYAAMVALLRRVREKWGIQIIDLWQDTSDHPLPPEKEALYMADPVHPTKAGYLEYWLPRFESALEALLTNCENTL